MSFLPNTFIPEVSTLWIFCPNVKVLADAEACGPAFLGRNLPVFGSLNLLMSFCFN
jgi:hypothetical protein